MEGNHPQPAELLSQLGWLRGLVRSLVRDPGVAEDVVQDTLIAAQSAGAKGRSLGWLAAVARNFVRQRFRSEGARERRERAYAVGESLPSEDELALRAERQRSVVDAVTRLPEPYKRVVILRYMDGIEPSEIARREQIPPATVRSQLKRALEKLRAELDSEFGSRDTWSAFLLPLADWPEAIPKTLPMSIPTGTSTLAVGSSLAMKKWIGLAVALALGAGGVWYSKGLGREVGPALVRTTSDDSERPSRPLEQAPQVSSAAERGLVIEQTDPARTEPILAPPTGWWLTGMVRGVEGDEPATIRITAHPASPEVIVEGASGANGRVQVDLASIFQHESLLPTGLSVLVSHPNHPTVRMALPVDRGGRQAGFIEGGQALFPIDVHMTQSIASVRGTVTAMPGVPLDKVRVALVKTLADESVKVTEAACDERGRFSLHARQLGTYEVVAWFAGQATPNVGQIPRPTQQTVELDGGVERLQLVLDVGVSIRGSLVSRGAPIGTRFHLAAHREAFDEKAFDGLVRVGERFEYEVAQCLAGSDGAFDISGLAAGAYRVSGPDDPWWEAERAACIWPGTLMRSVDVAAPANGVLIDLAHEVRSFVVESDSRPLPGAIARARDANGTTTIMLSDNGRLVLIAGAGAPSVDLTFTKPGFEAVHFLGALDSIPEEPWQPVELIRSVTGALELEVQGDEARTVERLAITLTALSSDSTPVAGGSEKHFFIEKRLGSLLQLGDLAPGTYAVDVRPGKNKRAEADNSVLSQNFEVDVREGELTRVPLVLDVGGRVVIQPGSFPGSASLSFILRDANGDEVPANALRFEEHGWMSAGQEFSSDDTWELFPTLAAGDYTIEVWSAEFARRVMPVVIGVGQDHVLDPE